MRKIAYLSNCFASISHTFMRREIAELRKLGVDISFYGIRPDIEKDIADDAVEDIFNRTFYLYFKKKEKILGWILDMIWSNVYFIFSSPIKYFSGFFSALLNEEKNIKDHLKLVYHFFVSARHAKRMKKQRIEHIHAHFINVSGTIAMYCSDLLGIPYSITAHSAGEADKKEMIGLRRKIKNSKFMVVISDYLKAYLIKSVYPCRDKTYIVRCGLDTSSYQPSKGHKYLFDKNAVRLLAVGRFVEKKGFEYLVRAAKLLKDSDISFRIDFLGGGPLLKKCRRISEKFGVSDVISFKGSKSPKEVKEYYENADIVIVPSVTAATGEMEGIPVVIMEALLMGVPVISTK
ncbi:glycosyltransferase, partial [Candidatus Woesearchaeota archaeon]|nr:glycosyltransferase [Candidatus Woesearchaeota archaeon]